MKKLFAIFATALFAVPVLSFAGDHDDFGSWLELGATKNLPRNFSVGLEGELRMQDNSSVTDRVGVGFNVSYKASKYFKFRAAYNFMESYSPEKRKEHYKEKNDGSLKLDADGNPIWNGYKITDSYWTPKHRVSLEATGSVKLWKWFRISLRERYQYTRRVETEYNEEKFRFDRSPNGDGTYEYVLKEDYPVTELETKAAQDDHVLRSRLKLEIDKKRLAWSPFVSVELHNDLTNSMDLQKVRACIGTEYKINRHQSVSLAYVFNCNLSETPTERMHAVSVGYGIEF